MESSLHFDDVLLRSNIYETAGWPSLAKFRKFGNIFKSLCNFLSGYSRCCTLNFWTYFLNFLKQFFTLVNGPMLNNNDLAIWSHWRTVLLAYRPFHSLSRWSGSWAFRHKTWSGCEWSPWGLAGRVRSIWGQRPDDSWRRRQVPRNSLAAWENSWDQYYKTDFAVTQVL